jgi:hypothetical protein
LSNITAGNPSQVQAVIDANLMPTLIRLLSQGDYQVQKEAVWAVTNVALTGTPTQILFMVDCGVVKSLCKSLRLSDILVVQVALDGLFNILKKLPDHFETISQKIEECGGLDKIEELQVCC